MPFFAVVLALLAPPQAARPAQIILFRHAEKPADKADPHLSPEGVRRARMLVGFLTSNPVVNKYGKPVAIFATKTTKDDDGQRTQETVAPAAAALKVQGWETVPPRAAARSGSPARRRLASRRP
jgi:broad specificity phosphatase PhoE